MEIWVKDLKTGNSWKLDEDSTKLVYTKNGQTQLKLSEVGRFRFFPCDPEKAEAYKKQQCHELEKNSLGYQFSLFDYEVDNEY